MASLVALTFLWMLQGISHVDGGVLKARDQPILDGSLSGLSTDSPVFNITTIAWAQAMNNPNATGHFPIVGYDVSQPFPTANPIDGWSIDLNVTDNIPNVQDNNSIIAGASIRLNPPPSLIAQTSNGSATFRADASTWHMCVMTFFDLPQSTVDAGKNDNGSCNSMFGEQCVLDIRSTWASAWSDGRRNADGCPSFVLPPRCGATIPEFVFTTIGINLNDSRFFPDRNNIVGIASLTSHKAGNNTDYNRIGGTRYPLVVSWGFRNRNDTGVKLVAPPPTLACIKADKALNGSQLPAAASQLGRIPGWMFGSLAVAAFLALV